MALMRQLSFASVGFEHFGKTTRRAAFLAETETVVPWKRLYDLIALFYPKPGKGRRPVGLDRMLRIYLLQHWFGLSDTAAEEALYDSEVMRRFVVIDLGREPVPDEKTILRFRHLVERPDATTPTAVAGWKLTEGRPTRMTSYLDPKSAVDNFCSGKDLSFEEDSRH